MPGLRKRLCVVIAAAALIWGGAVLAAMPGVGQPAPDFALKAMNGKNLRLSEMRGRVVMINFWATWCGPCRQELPLLHQLHQRYRDAGFTVLGVNIEEDTKRAATMARSLGIGFPVLFDNDKRVSRTYDPPAMPATLILDRSGRVRFVHLGYKPGYEKDYEREVRELLRE